MSLTPSPFTSQGYPFRKDLPSYSGEDLGRAFFADGTVERLGGLWLFDQGGLQASPVRPLYHDPYLLLGDGAARPPEVAVYIYSSTQAAELTDKYELLALRPNEVGVFAWVRGDEVELSLKLGATLLPVSRFGSEAAVRRARVIRPLAALRAQPMSAARVLAIFDLGPLRLLDPAAAGTLDDLRKLTNVVISRYETPSYLRRTLPPPFKGDGRIDVVIGLFFDGTGNNRYATELVYNQALDKDLKFDYKIINDFVINEFIENPYQKNGPGVETKDFMVDLTTDTSYLNAYSNIVLLHDLYQTQETYNTYLAGRQQLVIKHYVQGIGTLVDLDEDGVPKPDGYYEDDVLGSASGRGLRGVIHRVEEAFAHVAGQLRAIRAAAPDAHLGVLTFDVFGFSRGATAARHCLNELLLPAPPDDDAPAYGKFGKALQATGVPLPQQVRTRFAGLFDTVVTDTCGDSLAQRFAVTTAAQAAGEFASLLYENLGLSAVGNAATSLEPIYTSLQEFNGKAVHLIAADEHRENFALTASDAPNKTDVYLLGVHSDIGGSYAYDRYEAVVAYLETFGPDDAAQVTAQLAALAQEFRGRFTRVLKNGRWAIADPARRTAQQRRIVTQLLRTDVNARTEKKFAEHFLVVDSALLSNKLQLVALEAMLAYALAEKLPFQSNPARAGVPNAKFYEHPDEPAYQAYRAIIARLAAKPGGEVVKIPYAVYFPLSELYVHESANYNKSLLFGARGSGSILDVYANSPGQALAKQSTVGNQPAIDDRRAVLAPTARKR